MTTKSTTETTAKAPSGDLGKETVATRTAAAISGALAAGGKAYVSGWLDLARTLAGFGREILDETGAHARATINAKNLRELGELQVGYVQHRVETAATQAKEFADLVRTRAEDVIAPFTAVLKRGEPA